MHANVLKLGDYVKNIIIDKISCDIHTLEGGRVIKCILTMKVIDNRYMINVCIVDNKYWGDNSFLHMLGQWCIAKR